MRRVSLLVLATAVLACAPPAAGADLRATELQGTRFPDRGFVLTLPSPMAIDEGAVVARENGEPVSGLRVMPARSAEEGAFGVVLVIDTSQSMRGRPIADAVAAARLFSEARHPNQAVAIVAFDRRADVLLPFTTSDARIDAALTTQPPLHRGTRIYDGVERALALLRASRTSSGSVIVLSDGADTGSSATLAEVVARARGDSVRIFSVGLRSRTFDSSPLVEMARESGGRYSEAKSSGDLERLYGALAARLANEYLVTYRSDARPDRRVSVAITVDGIDGVALAEYTTPAAPPAGKPFRRPLGERFVLSAIGVGMTVAAFAGFFAIAFGVLLRRRPRGIRARMAEFVSFAAPTARDEAARAGDAVLAHAERSLSRAGWWSRFVEALEIAGIRISPIHIVLWTTVACVTAGWVVALLLGSPLYAVVALGIPLAVRSLIQRKLQRTRDLFADQLPDNLQVLASALRAGHSLVGALAVLVEDCPEPAAGEFRRVIADEQLGVSLDQALGVVARRMQSRDVEQVALVAALQRDTGGNTAEVLDRVAETVRGRFEVRRLVKTLTAQGRMSRWVVSLLPVALLGAMALLNPAYLTPLFSNSAGRFMLVGAAVLVVTGSLIIKRIINIKV